ncbi:MAG: hypothetical protein K2H01_01920 [Ruminococcus sp.]|nr:hypothetical protein [Ruminococcus sp.]
MKVGITKIGSCFNYSTQNPDKNDIENLWHIFDIGITSKLNQSKGSISIICGNNYGAAHISDFIISQEMTGSFWEVDQFNSDFEIGCRVWQQIYTSEKNSKMIYIHGSIFRNESKEFAITNSLTLFFNKLIQFKNLEDFLVYEEAHKDEEWENKEVCDKILELAKVIELYKKFHEINRALSVTHDMEDLINRRLISLLTNKE